MSATLPTATKSASVKSDGLNQGDFMFPHWALECVEFKSSRLLHRVEETSAWRSRQLVAADARHETWRHTRGGNAAHRRDAIVLVVAAAALGGWQR